MSDQKVRLSLEVTKPFKKTLENLAEALGCSQSEVFRKGLALYQVGVESKKRGETLALVNKDGSVDTLIVGL